MQKTVRADYKRFIRVAVVQLVFVSLVALGWVIFSTGSLVSSIMGGAVAIFPGLLFAWIFFRSSRSSDPKKTVRAFYLGEILKMVLTVGLAVFVFATLAVQLLPFLSGWGAAILGLWSAPKVFLT